MASRAICMWFEYFMRNSLAEDRVHSIILDYDQQYGLFIFSVHVS